MIIYYGTRMYGRVDQVGTASVRTRFFHISFLPLIPLGSYAVLDEGPGGGNALRVVPLGLHGRSVLAGYLRGWGFAAAILGAIAAYPSISHARDPIAALGVTFALAVPFLVALAALFWLGHLDTAARAQRWVYEKYAGSPIDVALLADRRFALRDDLHRLLVERGRSSLGGTYRTAMDPETQWLEMALDPATRDPEFVGAAFVRARIEWSLATGEDRSQYRAVHGKLWARVTELDPKPQEDALMITPPVRGRVALSAVAALALGGLVAGAWSERADVRAREGAAIADLRTYQVQGAEPPALAARPGGITVTDNVPLRSGDEIAYMAADGYRPGVVSTVGEGSTVFVRNEATGAIVETTRDAMLYYPEP